MRRAVGLALAVALIALPAGCGDDSAAPATDAPPAARPDALTILGLLEACERAARPDALREEALLPARAAGDATLGFYYSYVESGGSFGEFHAAAKEVADLYGQALEGWPDRSGAFAEWSAAFNEWEAAGSMGQAPDIEGSLAETPPAEAAELWAQAAAALEELRSHPGWEDLGGAPSETEVTAALGAQFATDTKALVPRAGALAMLGTLEACESFVATDVVYHSRLGEVALLPARELDIFLTSRMVDGVTLPGFVRTASEASQLYWWSWKAWGDASPDADYATDTQPPPETRYLWQAAAARVEALRTHPDWEPLGGLPGTQ